MNLPKFIVEILKTKSFSDADIKLIDSNWFFYADQGFRFGSATTRSIVRECTIVLACATEQDLSNT